jgi:hypothetical protein
LVIPELSRTVAGNVNSNARRVRVLVNDPSQDRKCIERLVMIKQVVFLGVKLPFMLFLMIFGFILEYVVELPFNLMTRLDARPPRRRTGDRGRF